MRQLMSRRWLLTHALVVGVVVLFLWLGWWQLGRGEAGNARSYAYSLEWPTFALLVVGFWVKIMRDEVRSTSTHAPADEPAHPAPAGDEDAEELAAYNRYLADLARQRSRSA